MMFMDGKSIRVTYQGRATAECGELSETTLLDNLEGTCAQMLTFGASWNPKVNYHDKDA